jgi:hypothetical protein
VSAPVPPRGARPDARRPRPASASRPLPSLEALAAAAALGSIALVGCENPFASESSAGLSPAVAAPALEPPRTGGIGGLFTGPGTTLASGTVPVAPVPVTPPVAPPAIVPRPPPAHTTVPFHPHVAGRMPMVRTTPSRGGIRSVGPFKGG